MFPEHRARIFRIVALVLFEPFEAWLFVVPDQANECGRLRKKANIFRVALYL